MPDSNRQTPDDNGEYELTVGQGEAPPLLPAETVESPLEASGLKDVMAGLYHAVEKYDALIQERFNSMNVASAQTAEQVTELQAQVKQLQEQVGQPSAATAEIATTVTALAAALEEIKTQMASNTPANPGKIPDGQDTRATGPSFLQEPHKSDPEIPGAEHFDDPQDTRNVLRVPLTERVPHLQVEDIVGVENLLKQLPGENNNVKWRRQPNGDIYLAVGKKVDFPAYPPDDAHDSVTLYLADLAISLHKMGFGIESGNVRSAGRDKPYSYIVIQPRKIGAAGMEWLPQILRADHIVEVPAPEVSAKKVAKGPPPLPPMPQ